MWQPDIEDTKRFMKENYGITPENIDEKLAEQRIKLDQKIAEWEEFKKEWKIKPFPPPDEREEGWGKQPAIERRKNKESGENDKYY